MAHEQQKRRDGFGTYLKGRIAATGGSADGAGGTRYSEAFEAAAVWIVNHNLGRHVIVSVTGAAGQEIEAEVRHVSTTQLRVYFDAPTAGSVLVT